MSQELILKKLISSEERNPAENVLKLRLEQRYGTGIVVQCKSKAVEQIMQGISLLGYPPSVPTPRFAPGLKLYAMNQFPVVNSVRAIFTGTSPLVFEGDSGLWLDLGFLRAVGLGEGIRFISQSLIPNDEWFSFLERGIVRVVEELLRKYEKSKVVDLELYRREEQ